MCCLDICCHHSASVSVLPMFSGQPRVSTTLPLPLFPVSPSDQLSLKALIYTPCFCLHGSLGQSRVIIQLLNKSPDSQLSPSPQSQPGIPISCWTPWGESSEKSESSHGSFLSNNGTNGPGYSCQDTQTGPNSASLKILHAEYIGGKNLIDFIHVFPLLDSLCRTDTTLWLIPGTDSYSSLLICSFTFWQRPLPCSFCCTEWLRSHCFCF